MRKDWTPPDKVRITNRPKARRSYPPVKPNRKYNPGEFAALILQTLGEGIWATPVELLAMLEFIDDEIELNNLSVTLHRMVKTGKLEWRRYSKERANGYQVKRPDKL